MNIDPSIINDDRTVQDVRKQERRFKPDEDYSRKPLRHFKPASDPQMSATEVTDNLPPYVPVIAVFDPDVTSFQSNTGHIGLVMNVPDGKGGYKLVTSSGRQGEYEWVDIERYAPASKISAMFAFNKQSSKGNGMWDEVVATAKNYSKHDPWGTGTCYEALCGPNGNIFNTAWNLAGISGTDDPSSYLDQTGSNAWAVDFKKTLIYPEVLTQMGLVPIYARLGQEHLDSVGASHSGPLGKYFNKAYVNEEFLQDLKSDLNSTGGGRSRSLVGFQQTDYTDFSVDEGGPSNDTNDDNREITLDYILAMIKRRLDNFTASLLS